MIRTTEINQNLKKDLKKLSKLMTKRKKYRYQKTSQKRDKVSNPNQWNELRKPQSLRTKQEKNKGFPWDTNLIPNGNRSEIALEMQESGRNQETSK